jgi:hypothetical protein
MYEQFWGKSRTIIFSIFYPTQQVYNEKKWYFRQINYEVKGIVCQKVHVNTLNSSVRHLAEFERHCVFILYADLFRKGNKQTFFFDENSE